jgi:hypothetical protein
VAVHRAWRLLVYATNGGGVCRIRELEFRGSAGGADQTGAGQGVAVARDSRNGLVEANAFDNSMATQWESANDGATSGHWIGWDFGVGNEKDVAELVLTITTTLGDAPRHMALEWTDDNPVNNGARWTRDWQVWDQTGWTSGETRTFTRPARSGQLHWRIFAATTPQGSFMAFAEVQMRNAYGGANIATGGTVIKSSEFSATTEAAVNAFDGNLSTKWASASGLPAWIGYTLPSADTVVELFLTARPEVGNLNQSPTRFSLDCSADKITWAVVNEWVGVPWPTSNFQNVVRVPRDDQATLAKTALMALVGASDGHEALAKLAAVALVGGYPNRVTQGKIAVTVLVQYEPTARARNGPVQII